ncbi:MAG: LptA/OstA family protein, partial [Synechococcus sp.]
MAASSSPAIAREATGSLQFPAQLQLTADRQYQDNRSQITVAEGNVRAQLGSAVLLADRIEFDSAFRTFHATGRVRLQRGRQSFQASRIRYNLALDEGVLEDVYGVIDLEGTDSEAVNTVTPSVAAAALQPMACPPLLPALPDWQPHPWAVTAWGGQMVDSAFGDTFLFDGRMRPEAVMGVSLQKRIFRAGPLAIEMEADLFSHLAKQQAGGEYNQPKPYAQLPAQSFGEGILGVGARLWLQ